MEFLELAQKRYSVRSFSQRPVEQEKLEKVLEAGRLAPPATNAQPQRILVLQGQEEMNRLGHAPNLHLAPPWRLWCALIRRRPGCAAAMAKTTQR